MSLIQKYIWVIETIYRARQISLRELSEVTKSWRND